MSSTSLQYATDDGTLLNFDWFPSQVQGNQPLVICIHGGGWISGDPSMMHEVALSMNRMGFSAACPEYRLAPLHTFPDPVVDLQAFIRHIRSNAEQFQVQTDAIAALGNSAGGYLAAMCGLQEINPSGVSGLANCVVDICGISDMTDPNDNHFPISMSFLEQFMGCSFAGNEDHWKKASPMAYVEQSAVPFLVIHGDQDEIVPLSQSQEFAGKLFSSGTPVEFHTFPGEGHSFSYPAWMKAKRLIEEFLSRNLKHERVA